MTTVKTWDISGMGGGYENACQKMLWTGVKYMKTLKNPQDVMDKENVAECEKLMLKAIGNDCTGAMMQKVTGHLHYIAKNGYEKWFKFMEDGRKPEQPTEFEWEDVA